MATVPQGNGKGKAVTVPSNLQTRTAVEAHLADGRIGREMLRTEEAVRQAKLSEIGNAPAPAPMPPPRPRVTQSAADKAVALRNATHDYYKTKFPFKEVHELFSREWIPGGPDPYKREYGWEGISGSPFVRWKSCGTPKQLHDMVSGSEVGKLNVGAMFSADPSNRFKEREPMTPVSREFVIDIDLDDYGNISKDDLKACDRNWPLVAIGLEVVKRSLQQHFGFKHILAVYSGRRGGHLWVCDERACRMSDEARGAIIGWLTPREDKGKKMWRYMVEHPNFKTLSETLVVAFFRTVAIRPIEDGGLGMFELPFQRKNFLALIDEGVVRTLDSEVCAADLPVDALDLIEKYCRSVRSGHLWAKYEQAVWEMIGPRIDVNVSKHANHTLKSPFSVHPKTGRVSVPILHDALDQFPVAQRAPLVTELICSHPNVSHDVLRRAVESFDKFIVRLKTSETERWKPPRTEIDTHAAKRPRVDYDMCDRFTGQSDEPVKASYPRLAWKLRRQWTVIACSDKPESVDVYDCVKEACTDNRVVIPPEQFPPFEHERRCSVDHIVSDIAQAITHAKENPGTEWHAGDKSYITVVHTGEETFSPKTHSRLTRLATRLAEPRKLCSVNIDWGEDSIKSFIRNKVVSDIIDLNSFGTIPTGTDDAHAGSSGSSLS